jgi:tRNA(His) 5'-end guanylyltransferase
MLSLNAALTAATEVIDSCATPVAIFLVSGEIKFSNRSSKLFDKRVEELKSNLVGVYQRPSDARHVREDLAEFYKRGA